MDDQSRKIPVGNPLPVLPGLVGLPAEPPSDGGGVYALVRVAAFDDVDVDEDDCVVMKNVDGNASIFRILESDSLRMN
jgi:hypothetical protein